MKTFFGIALIFVFLYMFFIPLCYLQYIRAEEDDFAALRLAAALDYAGEAAMSACMEADNISTDYADGDALHLYPGDAPETFAAVLCITYGLPPTEENTGYILSCIPVMTLADNNGYYLAEHYEDSEGQTALRWQIKRPYAVDTMPLSSDLGMAYAVTLSGEGWNAVNKATLTLTEGESYTDLPFTKEQALQQANLCIDTAINEALSRYAIERNQSWRQVFALPTAQGTAGVRRIESPTLLTILQDFSPDGNHSYSLSVVSGVSAAARRSYLAWTDAAGKCWYAYSVDAPAGTEGDIYRTPEAAAKAGYWPWLG